jgi:cytochrome b involved in lipid metabolism
MKKLTYTAFVAFWSSVATLLAVAVLAPDTRIAAQEELPVFTLEEVAEHASAESCWMAIEGHVYDVTDYLPMHPTPPDVLLPWCGREATEGMRTKGYGRDHSAAGWAMLDDYVIGTLEQ